MKSQITVSTESVMGVLRNAGPDGLAVFLLISAAEPTEPITLDDLCEKSCLAPEVVAEAACKVGVISRKQGIVSPMM